MNILSFEFLVFIMAVLIVYYVLPLKLRWLALLAGSAVFVSMSGWAGAAHMTVIALCAWLGGLALSALKQREKQLRKSGDEGSGGRASACLTRQKLLLAFVLIIDIGAMVFIKYEPAVAAWMNGLTKGKQMIPVWELAVPLGLSYFTFQSAGWLIDIYRGKAQAQRNPLKAWLFVGYFPQLAQGPISTWKELGEQLLTGHRLEPVQFVSGFQLMLWGYFKKMVIADRLAPTTAALLGETGSMPGWMVLGGVVLYMLRLYADFSGGMDVARGISRMLGIELPENFRRPFFSKSVAEYWRRWHITLGAWFRSYLMYPLTTSHAGIALGRRASKVFGKKTGRVIPTALATLLIFVLIGMWHSANWNALVYGAYFGLVMAASILLQPLWKKMNSAFHLQGEKAGVKAFCMARTWVLVLAAQFFAFTSSPRQGLSLLKQSFVNWDFSHFAEQMTAIMSVREWVIAGIAMAVLLLTDILCERGIDLCGRLAKAHIWVRWPVLLLLLMAILIFGMYGVGYDSTAFMYTQF
ncbi:MBOAT family O-acyltransferase [Murimonas intestini]|uniref:MBOAT family O-acyltransferase n=1 Tax=Murimonas intestini TaxID=1337051 RepID=UPI0011DD8194|nr:MBOAT family O-acyltransferase [Murimonas intestini]